MCGPMPAPSWRCCRPSLTLVRVHGGGEGGWGRSLELRIHAWDGLGNGKSAVHSV